MHITNTRVSTLFTCAALAVTVAACSPAMSDDAASAGEVPVTTSSDEARALYLEARAMADNIDMTDAYMKYEEAVAADPNFAMAYVGMANTAPSTDAFVAAVNQAVALADQVSEGERHIIMAQQAGMLSNPTEAMDHLTTVVEMFPEDERAHSQLGTLYFGRQDYATAASHYERATAINPEFVAAYNMLGYSERFQGNTDAAEAAFQQYINLMPEDPNSHDSYAELLMEVGRYDESIQHYERALELDANWVNSFVGMRQQPDLPGTDGRGARDIRA